MGMETITLTSVRTKPRRQVLPNPVNTWCTPLADAVAQMDGGELVVADNQLRVSVSLAPHVLRMVRQAPNIEADFRDGKWRVTSRREEGPKVILVLEPERG